MTGFKYAKAVWSGLKTGIVVYALASTGAGPWAIVLGWLKALGLSIAITLAIVAFSAILTSIMILAGAKNEPDEAQIVAEAVQDGGFASVALVVARPDWFVWL